MYCLLLATGLLKSQTMAEFSATHPGYVFSWEKEMHGNILLSSNSTQTSGYIISLFRDLHLRPQICSFPLLQQQNFSAVIQILQPSTAK